MTQGVMKFDILSYCVSQSRQMDLMQVDQGELLKFVVLHAGQIHRRIIVSRALSLSMLCQLSYPLQDRNYFRDMQVLELLL